MNRKDKEVRMIEHKIVGGTLYIGLSGELDESNAAAVRGKIDRIIDKEKMNKAVFVLSGLKFMDSTGIGVLLGRYRKLADRGVPIYVAGATKGVDKVLRISGIYGIMPKVEIKEA
ncbi:MAG: anti-sigma factor antagonist [Christensenellales bacterium]